MTTEKQMHSYGDSSESGDDFSMDERNSPGNSPVPSDGGLCFEGPEKNLEMHFKTRDALGCRAMSREMLDDVCSQAQCCILHKKSNTYFDAYILSESSLFVFHNRIVMKTCGTTTLLRCVPSILSYVRLLGLEFVRVLYSRKNFTFPEAQHFPHGSFEDESSALDRVFAGGPSTQKKKPLHNSAFIVGPLNADHWLTYVHESATATTPVLTIPATVREAVVYNRMVLNVMMFDLDRKVAQLFYRNNYAASLKSDEVAQMQTLNSGIAGIIPCSFIDAHAFEPCGYSMNGIHSDMYQTIHITPEEEGSYASFETTINYGTGSAASGELPLLESKEALREYTLQLVKNVVGIFKPERFMLTVTDCKQNQKDSGGIDAIGMLDEQTSLFLNSRVNAYEKSFASLVQMGPSISCHVSNWGI